LKAVYAFLIINTLTIAYIRAICTKHWFCFWFVQSDGTNWQL